MDSSTLSYDQQNRNQPMLHRLSPASVDRLDAFDTGAEAAKWVRETQGRIKLDIDAMARAVAAAITDSPDRQETLIELYQRGYAAERDGRYTEARAELIGGLR